MSRLLEALDAALRGQTDVELSAVSGHARTMRFAGSRVTQNGDVSDLVVQARAIAGGRLGAARTNGLDAHSLSRAIAQARAIAAAQRGPAKATGFDDGKTALPAVTPSWDAATAEAGADAVARLIEPAFAACAPHGLTAAGLAAAGAVEHAVATTAGARREFCSTSARLDVIASDHAASSRTSRYAIAIGALGAEELAASAVERALRSRKIVEVAPGPFDVILEPPAVAELLEWLALTGLGANAVEDGSSFLAGKRGQPVTGAQVTLADDPLGGADGCPTLPFDAEGTATRRVVSIDAGRAGDPVHDRASAARAGVSSTGHCAPLGDDLVTDSGGGPTAQHLQMAGGSDTAEALLSRVERGLWVSRFHYVNGLLDTRRALMTGMTRDGLFLVEKGKLGAAVRNLRWTESLLEAFARLDGITRARQVVGAGLSGAVALCPTVLVRGWRFTGTSR